MSKNDDSFEYISEPEPSSAPAKQNVPVQQSNSPKVIGLVVIAIAVVAAIALYASNKGKDAGVANSAEQQQQAVVPPSVPASSDKSTAAVKPADVQVPNNAVAVSSEPTKQAAAPNTAVAPPEPQKREVSGVASESSKTDIVVHKNVTKTTKTADVAHATAKNKKSVKVTSVASSSVVKSNSKSEDIAATAPGSELTVRFRTNSSYLSAADIAELKDKFSTLKVKTVNVNGYTDSIGPSDYNIWLSQRRADQVKKLLTEMGITDIHATGLGEDNPIASNSSADGRKLNRRVELFVAN